MKPVPREIWRLAVWSWQPGHSVIGLSLMDCSSSQSCLQDAQAYSYVGMAVPKYGRASHLSRRVLAPPATEIGRFRDHMWLCVTLRTHLAGLGLRSRPFSRTHAHPKAR